MQEPELMLAVIVPAYNVCSFLSKCLDSLLAQYDARLQILLVDDGSTDGTGDICLQYAQQQPARITLLRQRHQGLGAARNAGLAAAQARYVTFLDADDWYPDGWVAAVLSQLQTYDGCDIFFTLPQLYDMRTDAFFPWYDANELRSIFDEGRRTVSPQSDIRLLGLQPSCCARIFRRALLNGLGFRFPEGVLWEDILPHFLLLDRANSCRLIAQTGFIYRRGRPGQITNAINAGGTDLCAAYRQALAYAASRRWPEEKIVYIHLRIADYLFWRCRMASRSSRKQLIAEFHRVSCQMDPAQRKALRRTVAGNKGKRLLLWLITSDAYGFAKYLYDVKDCLKRVRGLRA